MSDTDNSTNIVGRKIFFLYPTGPVQNQVITELTQHEYEVYITRNQSRLSQALKKYTDSVLYINIDEGMSAAEWETWIKGILTALPDIKIGIFSANTDEELKNKYLKDLHVTCGYIALKVDMSKTAAIIIDILNSLNVKGRRKYLRATTGHETNATLNMPHDGGYIKASIKDISVVGISCVFDEDPDLKKNVLFKDLQIRLQSMLLKVEAITFGFRMDGEQKIYVLLFTQRLDPELKIKIRKYIQGNLQLKMDQEIK